MDSARPTTSPALAQYIKEPSLLENIPVSDRARGMLLRKEEQDKLVNVVNCYVRLFDLNVEEDKEDYTKLISKAANRKAEIRFLTRQWKPDSTGVMVYAEWADYVLDKG